MTHPPGGPLSPPPPSGPRRPVEPLDPNTDAGRAAAEALSQVLGEIQFAIWQRAGSLIHFRGVVGESAGEQRVATGTTGNEQAGQSG